MNGRKQRMVESRKTLKWAWKAGKLTDAERLQVNHLIRHIENSVGTPAAASNGI